MLNLPGIAERVADDLHARNVNAGRNFLRNEREGVGKLVISAEALQKNENQDVHCNQNIIDIRRD